MIIAGCFSVVKKDNILEIKMILSLSRNHLYLCPLNLGYVLFIYLFIYLCILYLFIQSTPDNSNLLGKSKIVRVIGSSKQITRSKEMGWGRNTSTDTHFTSRNKIPKKPCTRIFEAISHSFLHFSRAINVISYLQ